MTSAFLTIGTRGSPLALAQAHEVRRRLALRHAIGEERIALLIIRTTGDMIQDRALSEAGGKGLFTKELDIALLNGSIDIAVHSSKDLPTLMPDGIEISGYLPREDVRDALVSSRAQSIRGLPQGATLGTASLRRQAQVKRLRPDIKVALLRGNVETRLRKAESGEIDATLLAIAGMNRLGLAHRATALLDIDDFLPAVGQGAIAIAARSGDIRTHGAIEGIFDTATGYALAAERAFLAVLDGSCRTPIAGHARFSEGNVRFHGMVLRPDGSEIFEVHDSAAAGEAGAMGARAGADLLARLPPGILP